MEVGVVVSSRPPMKKVGSIKENRGPLKKDMMDDLSTFEKPEERTLLTLTFSLSQSQLIGLVRNIYRRLFLPDLRSRIVALIIIVDSMGFRGIPWRNHNDPSSEWIMYPVLY